MTSKSGDQPRHEGGGWQPIETAPKDGTWVFICWPVMPIAVYPAVAFWGGNDWELVSAKDYEAPAPTHWMPLPPPPANPEPPHA